jgi:hypothetical protein
VITAGVLVVDLKRVDRQVAGRAAVTTAVELNVRRVTRRESGAGRITFEVGRGDDARSRRIDSSRGRDAVLARSDT